MKKKLARETDGERAKRARWWRAVVDVFIRENGLKYRSHEEQLAKVRWMQDTVTAARARLLDARATIRDRHISDERKHIGAQIELLGEYRTNLLKVRPDMDPRDPDPSVRHVDVNAAARAVDDRQHHTIALVLALGTNGARVAAQDVFAALVLNRLGWRQARIAEAMDGANIRRLLAYAT